MTQTEENHFISRIEAALDTIRPHLQIDGGNIEVVGINDDMEVSVRWMGNCEFCSMSIMTMKAGVEQAIKQMVPEVRSITAVNGMEV